MKKISALILSTIVCSMLSAKGITISIDAGENWKEKRDPQVAVWLEDAKGNYVKTLYVTNRASKKSWVFSPKEGRPESLPVWYHAAKFDSNKESTGTRNDSDLQIDAVTSATPKRGIVFSADIDENPYIIKAEFNNSFDYNDFYTKENSGVNGQPSVIYEAELPAELNGEIVLRFAGTGDVNGKTGNISEDFSQLTTANKIVKCIAVAAKQAEK